MIKERFYVKLNRLARFISLYKEDRIVHNFRTMDEFMPYRTIKKSQEPLTFEENPKPLPDSFDYEGETVDIKAFLKKTWTTGFLVIKDDQILVENYYLGNTKDTLNISWSMGKSVVSALVGVAIDEGLLEGIDIVVSDLVPELKGSGYEGVSLKNVLQMSSGVAFDEDYKKFSSDINRMGRVISLGRPINKFAASLQAELEQGTYLRYVSMDTQVLAMVLNKVIPSTLSVYLEEHIWQKVGMEGDGKWLIDHEENELAFGTLNCTLRDYGRFGWLYAMNGKLKDKQIIPEQWVYDSTHPDASHLMPGDKDNSNTRMGYGYQWWLPANYKNDFMGLGIYGQHIYVNPDNRCVVVKLSANPNWTTSCECNKITTALCQHLAATL